MIQKIIEWMFETQIRAVVIPITVFLVIAVTAIWFKSSQEAASYRKFCDKPVTTWDAVWLDLRIDECQ